LDGEPASVEDSVSGRRADRFTGLGSGQTLFMADKRVWWKVVGTVSGLAAGMATKAVLRGLWRRVKGGDPPANPAAPGTSWVEALVWAASSGVAMAVTRLVAQRGAAAAWKAELGDYPPGLEEVTP